MPTRSAADRPDEAIKIIESIKRDNAGRWQAEAFGWLAVALAPRDRARAFALIDRALDMITDDSIAVDNVNGLRDAGGRAHRRLRAANRLPRHGERRHASDRCPARQLAQPISYKKLQFVSLATIDLALLDPGMARTVLKQVEAHCRSVGLNPAGFANDRGRWLMAWALADLEKAETLFEAELAALDERNERDLLFRGLSTRQGFWRPRREPRGGPAG